MSRGEGKGREERGRSESMKSERKRKRKARAQLRKRKAKSTPHQRRRRRCRPDPRSRFTAPSYTLLLFPRRDSLRDVALCCLVAARGEKASRSPYLFARSPATPLSSLPMRRWQLSREPSPPSLPWPRSRPPSTPSAATWTRWFSRAWQVRRRRRRKHKKKTKKRSFEIGES